MPNEKLYYADPYLQEFTARINRILPLEDGRFGIVLDRTAFYPEGGGQPSDSGLLDDIAVTAVTEQGGEILHITAAKPRGDSVHGRIDWSRRFDHMQQHSGEHMLSAAFIRLFQAENIGFHLGADSVTIDVTLDSLTAEQAAAVEKCANEFVFANIPVSTHHVIHDELAGFSLRKLPSKSFTSIRLVDISGVDCCPCGGTHVANTGEVGLIKIRSWERKNSAVRVDFVCGWRALADYSMASGVVQQLSSRLSAPPPDVAAAVERQLLRADSLAKALHSAKQELNRNLAARLYAVAETKNGRKIVAKALADYSSGDVADLAKALLDLGPAVVLLGTADSEQNKSQLLFTATPAGAGVDMAALLKTVLPGINGRGGGNALRAQGGGTYTADLEKLLLQAGQRL